MCILTRWLRVCAPGGFDAPSCLRGMPSVCFKMVTMMQRDRIFERLLGILIFLDLALFPTSTEYCHACFVFWWNDHSMLALQTRISGVPPAAARPSETVSRSKVVPPLPFLCIHEALKKSSKDHRLGWLSLHWKVHADDFWTTLDSQTWLVVPVHSIIAATFILAERSECI